MPKINDETDNELLRRICAGDEAAFVTLYRRQGNVYRFALRMCGSEVATPLFAQQPTNPNHEEKT